MILVNLPKPETPPIPAFASTVTLESVTYTLRFAWNDRDGAWYVRILDEPGQVTLMGDWRVNADWPFYRSRIVRSPPGFLLARDTSGKGIPPGLADLGARVLQAYAEAAELPALGLG